MGNENTKGPVSKPAPQAPKPPDGAGGSHNAGSAPGGNPRNAPLPGPNRVPDDAKGYNPGSVVTG